MPARSFSNFTRRFRNPLTATWVAVHLALFASTAMSADRPVFPPPPRLATSVNELAALRASPAFAATKEQTIAAADALLKDPAVVPSGPGAWTFYYACPDDGNPLVPLNLAEHRCPKCSKVYRDERTVAAYRTLLHDRANNAAEKLGWAFAYTQDSKYAVEAQRILVKLADDYAAYPRRRDRWGHEGLLAPLGGRRYSQSLDEAVGIIPLAKAYDLTRNAPIWTDDVRKHVEADLFRATADTLLWSNLDINNHQTWFNAGLMSIASVLGDAALAEKVVTMRGGFRDQLARSVDRDGLWYEGTMAYQNYALQAMIEIVNAGRRMGLPLHHEPKFRTFLTGPLKCAYPNGQFPAINDSDPMSLSVFDGSFRWAAEIYGKDWPGNPIPPAEAKSVDLSEAGLAVLRRGTRDKAVCAMIDYGPHGGDHGHLDKLNIVLYANGREWLLDPGRLDYSHKEYKTWVKHTAAHNTVTLGGKSQARTTGEMLWFEEKDHYVACAARSDQAYPGAVLTRYLLLTDDLLIDLFTVDSKEEAQIDLLTHAISDHLQRDPPIDDAGKEVTPGADDGYPHLTSARAWDVKGDSHWDFIGSNDLKLRAWLSGNPAEQQIAATGIGYYVDAKVPCLIRRITDRHAQFATAYDLGGKGTTITGFTMTKDRPLQVQVETSQGKRICSFSEQGAQFQK